VLAVAVLVGCSDASQPAADDVAGHPATEADVDRADSHASPVIFAFTCESAAGRSATYTTYAAVWEAERTSCSADRLTGSVPSEQQQAALDATRGTVTLQTLAATCAVRGSEPWDGVITNRSGALLAAGAELYCPGHPEMDHLREALAAYRG
jgi:hypothetical protein